MEQKRGRAKHLEPFWFKKGQKGPRPKHRDLAKVYIEQTAKAITKGRWRTLFELAHQRALEMLGAKPDGSRVPGAKPTVAELRCALDYLKFISDKLIPKDPIAYMAVMSEDRLGIGEIKTRLKEARELQEEVEKLAGRGVVDVDAREVTDEKEPGGLEGGGEVEGAEVGGVDQGSEVQPFVTESGDTVFEADSEPDTLTDEVDDELRGSSG